MLKHIFNNVKNCLFINHWIIIPALLLIALGLLMVTSASMPIGADLGGYNQPFFFIVRQLIFTLFGTITASIVFQVPIRRWKHLGPKLLVLAACLLLIVLIPGIGKELNGSIRWIGIGPLNIQVSEVAKLFVIIYISSYLDRHGIELRLEACSVSLIALLRPIGILAIFAVLLLMEPDFGSVVVLMVTALGMVFLAGVNLWYFGLLQIGITIVMTVLIFSSSYRRDRVLSFLSPWEDPFGKGYQLAQSLIAIGRGELFGVGLGKSIQKLFYLPEAHTDFLLAVLAEELGLFGIMVVTILFMILVWQALEVGRRASQSNMDFAAYLSYGIGIWFGIQALFNMGVNMGVLPTKGLTLPLMSYGGSSLVVMCTAIALLLRVDAEIMDNRVI